MYRLSPTDSLLALCPAKCGWRIASLAETKFEIEYMDFANGLLGRGKNITKVSECGKAAAPYPGAAAFSNCRGRSKRPYSVLLPGVCAVWSTSFMEFGFLTRMNEITFHKSSDVLMMFPKGGIGPVTISFLTRV